MTVQNINLSTQRLKVTEAVGLGSEVWASEAVLKALTLAGVLDVHFADTAPTSTRKLWLRYSTPATGAPGTLYRYNADTSEWVIMTALEFTTFLNVSARPNIYYQSTLPVDPIRGDYWWHTDEDGVVSIYMPTGAATAAWIDFSGGVLDLNTLAQVAVTYSNGASPHANPKFGDWWTSPANGREYLYTRAAIWRDMSA